MNNALLKMYETDELNHIPNCIKNKLNNLRQDEIESWDFAPDHVWVDKIIDKFISAPTSELPQMRFVLQCLQTCVGKVKIMYYLAINKRDFIYCIQQAVKDHNYIDNSESYIIPFKNKNGTSLKYVPSIHAQYADWQLAKPDCSLTINCWSIFELESWIAATGKLTYPGPYDKPEASDAATALKLALYGPTAPDYKVAGIQLIKHHNASNTILCTGYWYPASALDEYAQNYKLKQSRFSPWSGQTRKTDMVEMYKKTAKRNFIKQDAGPVLLRYKTTRGSKEAESNTLESPVEEKKLLEEENRTVKL